MKLLFDQGTPAPLRNRLPAHSVDTLAERGWSEKDNGELLDLAEREGSHLLASRPSSLPFDPMADMPDWVHCRIGPFQISRLRIFSSSPFPATEPPERSRDFFTNDSQTIRTDKHGGTGPRCESDQTI